MKYSKRFQEDYQFYNKNTQRFNFCGKKPEQIDLNPGGFDAKKCFYLRDSTGVSHPCKEPEKLQELLVCKASVNWHIKQWSEGLTEGSTLPHEINEIVKDIQAPEWVLKAIVGQTRRLLNARPH